jgi:hypothetical protein
MCNCHKNDANSVCPRCGSHFHCSMEDSGMGIGYCWCVSMPKIDLGRDIFPGRCLCKQCLNDLRDPIREKHNEIKENR